MACHLLVGARGVPAILRDGQWSSGDPDTLQVLRDVAPEGSFAGRGYLPDPDLALAQDVLRAAPGLFTIQRSDHPAAPALPPGAVA